MPKHAMKKRSINKSLLLSLGAIIVVGLLMFTVGKVSQGNNSHSVATRSAKQTKKSKDCQTQCQDSLNQAGKENCQPL
nr:hypothetical protein [Lentilactobacillus otakiensis]